MAHTLAETYVLAAHATKLRSAADARTLTNNPSAPVVAAVEDAVASLLAVANGAGDSAIVPDGAALVVPVTGTYATTATVSVVDGVVTGIVLS